MQLRIFSALGLAVACLNPAISDEPPISESMAAIGSPDAGLAAFEPPEEESPEEASPEESPEEASPEAVPGEPLPSAPQPPGGRRDERARRPMRR
jgi:hypothetical protein